MKVLVTGAAGFVGRHLARNLAAGGHSVVALDSEFPSPVECAEQSLTVDLRDKNALAQAFTDMTPDACVHLGAISFVPAGVSDPGTMLSVNIGGTLNLLEIVRDQAETCRTLVVSTAQIYAPTPDDSPITEDGTIAPINLYAVTKSAADLSSLAFASRYDLPIMTARPNNHTGPGQSPHFVVPSFISQITRIAVDKTNPVMQVGNLESERIFADVRDIVRAYRLLLEKGHPGEAYNVSGPDRLQIGTVLDLLCKITGITVEKKIDPGKFRPTDKSPILDTTRLQKQTGWRPEINIEQTLRDMVNDEG